jgi:O-antigen biosynthesis protein
MFPFTSIPPKLAYRSAFSAWEGHAAFALYLIRELRPRTFVELGTHWADSYFAFCQGVAEWRLPTRCFAVDTWTGDSHAGKYGEDVYDVVNAYHQGRYTGFSRLLRMEFDEAQRQFPDGGVDLLHIDGYHTYEAVRHDFETWLPKMSDRGVILFHDTCVRTGDFGVYRLWDELAARYPAFQFTHSSGLGVVCVGTQVPPPLVEPCSDPNQAEIWRSKFSRWSELLLAEAQVDRLRADLDRYRAESDRRIKKLERHVRRTAVQKVKRKLKRAWHRLRGTHAE